MWGSMADKLKEMYIEYMKLDGYRAEYLLQNGTTIEFTYEKKYFGHLLGLHKLTDIQIIQFWQDKSNLKVNLKSVIRQIKKEQLTDADIKKSTFYPQIKERYENFSYDTLTSLNYTDAIIDFDASLLGSKLKSDYLLYEINDGGGYNHMGLAIDSLSGKRYAETFFIEPTGKYLTGQNIVKIVKFTLYDEKNRVVVTDTFST